MTEASVTGLANWSGNYTYRAPRIHRPDHRSARCRTSLPVPTGPRPLAAGTASTTSPTRPGDLIDLTGLPDDLEVTGDGTVTVTAGISYGRLATALQEHSLALRNLASLPHISVAGAVATRNPRLRGRQPGVGCVAVRDRADSWRRGADPLRRGRDADFAGAVVGLGALGIVRPGSRLDVEPASRCGRTSSRICRGPNSRPISTRSCPCLQREPVPSDLQGPAVSQVWCKSRLTQAADSTVFDPVARFGRRSSARRRPPSRGTRCRACRVTSARRSSVSRGRGSTAAAFPARVHPEQRRRTADRVPVPRDLALDVLGPSCAGSRPGSRRCCRSARSGRWRLTSLVEPGLPAGLHRLPFHLGSAISLRSSGLLAEIEAAPLPGAVHARTGASCSPPTQPDLSAAYEPDAPTSAGWRSASIRRVSSATTTWTGTCSDPWMPGGSAGVRRAQDLLGGFGKVSSSGRRRSSSWACAGLSPREISTPIALLITAKLSRPVIPGAMAGAVAGSELSRPPSRTTCWPEWPTSPTSAARAPNEPESRA